MKDKPASADTDWILKAMIAVAASDGSLDGHETSLIQQLYLDQSGRALSAEEVARAAQDAAKSDTIAEFAAQHGSKSLGVPPCNYLRLVSGLMGESDRY